MKISEAKEIIRDTIKIYLERDDFGELCIPASKQRPIYMVGTPGIGKTAIVEQLSAELGISLVSYSMTHLNMDAARGVLRINRIPIGDKFYEVAEYTMSEIIASVYRAIESSKKKEGILFLDEINSVDQSLFPLMLQFLQYKSFGNVKVPEGWVIVTAGNPPEYNQTARKFDTAISDRLKYIRVQEDCGLWLQYAWPQAVHGAVLSYLYLNPDHFSILDGERYVTPRGWEDLAVMLKMYEKHSMDMGTDVIRQYLADDSVVDGFSAYYRDYHRWELSGYAEQILSGRTTNVVDETVRSITGKDLCIFVTQLLCSEVALARAAYYDYMVVSEVHDLYNQLYNTSMEGKLDLKSALLGKKAEIQGMIVAGGKLANISKEKRHGLKVAYTVLCDVENEVHASRKYHDDMILRPLYEYAQEYRDIYLQSLQKALYGYEQAERCIRNIASGDCGAGESSEEYYKKSGAVIKYMNWLLSNR